MSTLPIPIESNNPVISSPRPFVVGDRSYIALEIKDVPTGQGQPDNGEIWIFDLEDDPHARYAERCDEGQPRLSRSAPVVYVGAGDGGFHAVDAASGQQRWRFATGARVRGGAAIAADRVVFGSADHFVYAPDRKTDVLQLANFFLEKFATQHAKNVKRIATPAIDMLMAYHWPGNVRELENAIERAVVVCNEQVLHAHHLPPTLQTAEETGTVIEQSLDQATEAFEKDILQDALKSARGNRAKAARLLRTTGRVFNYKVRKYGIDWKRFRG